jgi:hypothetical protein
MMAKERKKGRFVGEALGANVRQALALDARGPLKTDAPSDEPEFSAPIGIQENDRNRI